MGLLDPASGNILADNLNILNIKSKWHKKIGCVPQDVFILDTTVAKNISFSSDKESDNLDKVKMSINKANLDSFIKNSENGLDSNIGERGSRISGGEKQRIGIARIILIFLFWMNLQIDKQTENKIIQKF